MRRTLPILSSTLLLLLLLFQGLGQGSRVLSASPLPQAGDPARLSQASTELISAGDGGLEFVLQVPSYDVDATGTVLAPGLTSATRQEGAPSLPAYSTLVLLPPEADVRVAVEVLDRQVQKGIRIRPAPQLDRTSIAPSIREVMDSAVTLGRPTYAEDASVYGQDALYPSYNYRVSQPMYYRDLRLVRLELFPLRYNPAAQTVDHATAMRVSLSFEGAEWQKVRTSTQGLSGTSDPIASQVLNYEQGRRWRAFPSAIEAGETKLPMGVDTFKIAVNEDGIYELGYDELQAAGMDVDNVDPRTLEMMYRGQPVAYEWVGNDDNTFDDTEKVRFYAWAFDGSRLERQFLTENVFWLWAGGTPSQIGSVPSNTANPAAESFRESITREPERVYEYSSASWPSFPNEPDSWFWSTDEVTSGDSLTTTRGITLPAPFAGGADALVTVEILSNSSGPNHDVAIALNDAQAYSGNHTWENIQDVNVTTTVPMTVVLSGLNEVQIRYDTEVASGKALYFLNRITVDYQRRFVAQNGQLIFEGSGSPRTYNVSGFGSNSPLVWEITDRRQPRAVTGVEVSGSPGPYSYTFGTGDSNQAYIATQADNLRTPLSIHKYVPPSLEAGGGAEWIAISHANFMNAAQALASHRSDPSFGNLSTHIVDIADIINQYGYGLPLPAAISNYLAHALADWQVAPRYAVLVGDGHVNPRQIRCERGVSFCDTWDLNEPNYVPTDIVYWDQIIGINNSDYSFSLLSGNDLIPDIAVGRLAVQTNDEAMIMVNKIVNYETSHLDPQDWQRDVVFVADDSDLGGDFCSASMGVGATLPATFNPLYLCLPENTEEAIKDLRGAMHDAAVNGATFLNFRGHGGTRTWAGNLVNLDNPEIAPPIYGNEPLVILSMDCYDGFFARPGDNNEALSEFFLQLEAEGSVAHWSSTGLGWDFQHRVLHQGFYDGLFGQGQTAIGDAANYAKLQYVLSNLHRSQLYSFVLQGDPAMQLMRPDLSIDKRAVAPVVHPGEEAVFTLDVRNDGLYPAAPTIVDTLPEKLEVSGVSATVPATISVTNKIVTATLDSPLLWGASARVTVTATVQTALERDYFKNEAVVGGSGLEAIPHNNQSSAGVFFNVTHGVFLPAVQKIQ